jgi:hypothetical protein
MIASFARGFIFLKTRKTAGTSIELALTPQCGIDDVLTPLAYDDELMRLDGALAARNFTQRPKFKSRFDDAIARRDRLAYVALMRQLNDSDGFYNHIPAAQLRSKLDAGFWSSAWKFTVERHPYEKVVSIASHQYAMMLRRVALYGEKARLADDFASYLDFAVTKLEFDPEPVYLIDGVIAADQVIPYENLDDGLRSVAARLGLRLPEQMPRAKSNFRSDRRPAAEILTDAQKETIFRKFRRTFDLFDYRP